MHQNFTPWNSRGQGHSVTLARGHVCCLSTFSKGFFIETTGPFSFKFHMQPSIKGGKKIYIFRPGHIILYIYNPVQPFNLIIFYCSFPLYFSIEVVRRKPLARNPCLGGGVLQ